MPSLNVPQARFLELPHKFKAFVGGFGSGKTWVGCSSLCRHFWEHPKINGGYFAPTYPQIRDIFYPTIEEVAHDWGLRLDIHQTNKEVAVYSGRQYRGTILCRSMEKPNDIVGFKIGKALIDEMDLLKQLKAELAWRKIIARMRYNIDGLQNGIDVTTTPEGFNFVYNQFVKQVRDKPSLSEMYGLVQSSTYENEANLPDDYISSLFETYPKQLIDAYLYGQFCNLASGSVYQAFDRKLNHSDLDYIHGETLHIGMDFNVMNMSAVVNVIREGNPITVREFTGVRDTPEIARLLNERFKDYSMIVYPDASGKSRGSTDASKSDLSILEQNGFKLRVDPSNPAVKDRVNAMNAVIENAEGVRRWKVNTNNCPNLTESLEQQAYDKNGEPDKTTGHDHLNDAQGYFINQLYPIVRRSVRQIKVTGI